MPRWAHRSAKACENIPDGGAESVPGHIHRELKVESDLKIICLDDRHLLDFIRCLRAGSLTDEVLLCCYLLKIVKKQLGATKRWSFGTAGPPITNSPSLILFCCNLHTLSVQHYYPKIKPEKIIQKAWKFLAQHPLKMSIDHSFLTFILVGIPWIAKESKLEKTFS